MKTIIITTVTITIIINITITYYHYYYYEYGTVEIPRSAANPGTQHGYALQHHQRTLQHGAKRPRLD